MTGDYSIKGLEKFVTIERKSAEDMLSCVAGQRARFAEELERMHAYPVRAVIVETSWSNFKSGLWQRSRVNPKAARNSVLGWIALGIPFIFAGDAIAASDEAATILFLTARRRWAELGAFYESLKIAE